MKDNAIDKEPTTFDAKAFEKSLKAEVAAAGSRYE